MILQQSTNLDEAETFAKLKELVHSDLLNFKNPVKEVNETCVPDVKSELRQIIKEELEQVFVNVTDASRLNRNFVGKTSLFRQKFCFKCGRKGHKGYQCRIRLKTKFTRQRPVRRQQTTNQGSQLN